VSGHGPTQREDDGVDERRAQQDRGGAGAEDRAKYRRYAGSIVDGITNAQARSMTLKLAPHTRQGETS
jgi:hypothetical protein